MNKRLGIIKSFEIKRGGLLQFDEAIFTLENNKKKLISEVKFKGENWGELETGKVLYSYIDWRGFETYFIK